MTDQQQEKKTKADRVKALVAKGIARAEAEYLVEKEISDERLAQLKAKRDAQADKDNAAILAKLATPKYSSTRDQIMKEIREERSNRMKNAREARAANKAKKGEPNQNKTETPKPGEHQRNDGEGRQN